MGKFLLRRNLVQKNIYIYECRFVTWGKMFLERKVMNTEKIYINLE